MKTTITMMAALLGVMGVAKTVVHVPTIPTKTYTGEYQRADVPESELYEITYNEQQMAAGEYEVELQLTDPANYTWPDTDDDWVVVPFHICQAMNSWTTPPSIEGWTYGETANAPIAVAQFGNVKVRYDGTAKDGTVLSDATSVTKAGDYEAVFTVAGNANYTGLTNRVPFSVAKAGVSGGGGSGWSVSMNVSGYEGAYDGEEHSITVEITGDEASSFSVTYALSVSGPFSAAKPMFTNVCSEAVWYVLSSPNYATVTNSATVTIKARSVTLTSANVSKQYDGTPLVLTAADITSSGIVAGESFTYSDFSSRTEVGQGPATFSYAAGPDTSLANYSVECFPGTLTVTKATAGGGSGGGDEPGGGEVPQGGESKFDATAVYDGEGHTIDTNALTAAFGAAVIGEFAVAYAADDGSGNGGRGAPALPWGTVPVYTNVGEYIVWYRVTNPNYNDFIHAAKVSITNRPVTVTSADDSWTYDEQPHSSATVTTEGFVSGEGIVANNFATITDVGSEANSFDYSFADGTLAGNYLVTCVTGTLTIVAADMGGWTDDAKWSVTLSGDGAKYDGTDKTCAVTALAYDGFAVPTFTVTGNTATDAGDYTLTVTGTGNFSGSYTFPWSIAKRMVTLTSGSDSKVFDGAALVKHEVAVSGDGFASGEGASYNFTGSQTDVGTSENSFTYTLNGGTKAGNYDITIANGTLTVTKATYDMSGVQWDYAGEFAYDRTEKTVTVTGTLPSGVSVASYTGNKATLPGTYTAHVVFNYDTTNYNEPTLDDLSWKIKSAEETTLRKIFDEPPAIITPDGDGWKVTLTGDMTGPIDIPDNLGHVTIDLNGYKITGPDGAVGSETAPGGDGTPAIRIVPSGSDDGAVTRISLVTSGGNSLVKGGDGGSGNPGGNGAPAIKVLAGTRDGVLIDVGAGVTVQGGVGGKGLGGGDDGDDGVPIDGEIGDVQGTLIRARVTPPVIAAKEYTGSAQVADVPASPRWSTVFNEGGTAVATYIVALELTDPVRYKWTDTDNATLYLSFNITRATIDISAVGWNYSEPLPYTAYPQEVMLTNLPAGVTATYTGNKATETGTYTAHATLNYNTDNFVVAAVPDCVWTIKPAVPIDGGNTDSLGGSTINYSGIYDGEAHGISVILRDPRPAGACVRYSRSKNGPYTDENPLFTDVCRETVWYLVTADHYEALTNSATVTIDPKPFTAGLVKHKGLKEIVENGASKIVPTFVIEDNWPCKVEERDWELVDWTPRVAGGGTAVLCGRNNYTGQVTVEIGNEMTVLFDAVYGADRETLRVFTTQEPGKPYVFPTEPSYHGHAFRGWFTAKTGGEQVAPGTIVSLADPDTLYAHWTVKTFHMSYELNGGTGDIEDFDAEYGSAFGAMPMPKKPGYMFDGWWTTADFQNGTKVSEGDGVPFRDTTLFAKWERRRLWYHDTAFHLEKAETWNGYVVDPAAGDVVAGTIQVKAGKPNKKTGLSKLTVTVQLSGGKKKKLKGSTFDGTFTGDLDGRALYIKLGYSSLSGTFGGYALDGTRNVFTAKDADSKIVAARALNRWQGTYVVAWPGVAGWNGLSLEVKTKGKVKASGTLADGTRVSATTQLLVGERESAIALSWTKKTASVACLVWLCEDGTLECANLPGGVSALIANARSGAYLQAGAKLHIGMASLSAVVPGLQENLLPDGMEVRMNGTKFDVDKAGRISVKNGAIDLSKAGTNPSGLKLNYKVKDCTFKGSFNGYVLSGGKLKKVRVQVSGVVLGRVGYGTATVKKVGSVPVTISP